MSGADNIIWADLEMTGLDPSKDVIIEIASIITDANLEIVAEGPDLVIHAEPERFDDMDEWNQSHHKGSGLWQKVVESDIEMKDAELETLAFIKKHVPKGKGQLAGNSIWQDRRFIYKYMPKLDTYLHYRMIDISGIKSLAERWYPKLEFKKKEAHRALEDIRESIEELKFYREHIFKEM